MCDAPGADQKVDSLADGDAAPAQKTKIRRRRDRNGITDHRDDLETAQQSLGFPCLALAGKPLQDLAQHEIAKRGLVGAEDCAQLPDMGRITTAEEVDPHAAVDNDHPVPRPLRLRARLPRIAGVSSLDTGYLWRLCTLARCNPFAQ